MAAFGFSVGDFFSAATLILQATKALRESDAARTECQQAAAFLEGVERTLRKVVFVMSPDGDPDAYQDIIPYAEACRKQVVTSLERFKKYEGRLTDISDGPKPAWQRMEKMLVKNRMKLKCVFASKADLAQIRGAITPKLELLQLSLQFVEMRKTTVIIEAQRSIMMTTQSIHTRLDYLANGLESDTVAGAEQDEQLVQCNEDVTEVPTPDTRIFPVPLVHRYPIAGSPAITSITYDQVLAIMVYVWQLFHQLVRVVTSIPMKPSFLLDTNIQVQDALGRSLSLPYEHFRYWPVLMARLEVAFEQCPGQIKIRRSRFAMFAISTGQGVQLQGQMVLNAANWDQGVQCGHRFVMSMCIEGQGHQLDQCPRCGSASSQAGQIGWSTCTHACLVFLFDQERSISPLMSRLARYGVRRVVITD
ncbi:hypothetical protein LTR27_008203 [Elasticomyces elasticus]|nr:hypothetical protein LTR27_008203 [Elasticomyces elasticus]